MHPRFVEYQRGGWRRHHELADGRVMVPVFGPMKEEPEAWALAVGFSADGGRTFIDLAVMATAPAEKRKFCENSILRLDDGRFLAVIREETPPKWSYQCYSEDDGKTWTTPMQINFKGQCPCLVHLRSGAILCAYRDMEPDRPGVSISLSEDNGETWR